MKHVVRGYAKTKGQEAIYAVLTEDMGGLTYVARWIRTDSLVMIPDELSWEEKFEFSSEQPEGIQNEKASKNDS